MPQSSESTETDTTDCQRQLDQYIAEIAAIVDARSDAVTTAKAVADANLKLNSLGFTLPEALRKVHPGVPYSRNLIHQDPANRFSIIAIIWGAFQETGVHDHLNWCVVNVLEGNIHSIDYDRHDDEQDAGKAELSIRRVSLEKPGSVCALTPPPRTNIHKLANASGIHAISLHTYGDPGTKARCFNPVTGKVEILDLEFHNV